MILFCLLYIFLLHRPGFHTLVPLYNLVANFVLDLARQLVMGVWNDIETNDSSGVISYRIRHNTMIRKLPNVLWTVIAQVRSVAASSHVRTFNYKTGKEQELLLGSMKRSVPPILLYVEK